MHEVVILKTLFAEARVNSPWQACPSAILAQTLDMLVKKSFGTGSYSFSWYSPQPFCIILRKNHPSQSLRHGRVEKSCLWLSKFLAYRVHELNKRVVAVFHATILWHGLICSKERVPTIYEGLCRD